MRAGRGLALAGLLLCGWLLAVVLTIRWENGQ